MIEFSIDERVPMYEIRVNNAVNDAQISEVMGHYGYSPETMASMQVKVSEVKDLIFRLKKEYGDQYQATVVLDELRLKAHKYYMRLLKFGRILMDDDMAAVGALVLSGKRKEEYGAWIIQVQTFYNNLLSNNNYLSLMASLNCSEAVITEGKEMLEAVIKAKEQQEIERGEAQLATVERNEKVAELDQLMSRFTNVATVVFADEPQVLEKLGITKN